MCGICGIVNFDGQPVSDNSISKMMQLIKHRGPNDEGKYVEENLGMGFVRLSIIDLSSKGHQPMLDKSGRYSITHNGEVYNYLEIKNTLLKKGYTFKSGTDTEVILNSYIEWGEDCLHKFNGMWSFVIYDKIEKSLFISRDRFGIKPFYYYYDKNRFIYSSEIKSIISCFNKEKVQINDQSLYDYLVFNRTDQSDDTFYRNIKKLQHGHFITITNNQVQIKKWYNLNKSISNPFLSKDEYLETFRSSIKLRLRSDVPIGLMLSGGIDSSSIASVLKDEYSHLNTFSAIFPGEKHIDESKYIYAFKQYFSNMHFITPDAESLFSDLHRFIQLHDEPVFRTGPYIQFKLMELAKNYVTVILEGQGADEQLAGYHYFFGFYYKELLRQGKIIKLFNELVSYSKTHKSFMALNSLLFLMLPRKIQGKAKLLSNNYIKNNFYNHHYKESVIANDLYSSKSLKDSLLNHFEYKLEHLLKWGDKNSMYFGLESRMPFLDHRLVERTLATDNNMIINKGKTKVILKEASKKILPDAIYNRQDKIGFATPEDDWYRKPKFKEYIFDLIQSNQVRNNYFVDSKKMEILYKQHLNQKINIGKELWKWINIFVLIENLNQKNG